MFFFTSLSGHDSQTELLSVLISYSKMITNEFEQLFSLQNAIKFIFSGLNNFTYLIINKLIEYRKTIFIKCFACSYIHVNCVEVLAYCVIKYVVI